ncbi:MAG: hypothetical protein ABI142_09415, partial [Bryocella sp.]
MPLDVYFLFVSPEGNLLSSAPPKICHPERSVGPAFRPAKPCPPERNAYREAPRDFEGLQQ